MDRWVDGQTERQTNGQADKRRVRHLGRQEDMWIAVNVSCTLAFHSETLLKSDCLIISYHFEVIIEIKNNHFPQKMVKNTK
jgi:hypothetical protein